MCCIKILPSPRPPPIASHRPPVHSKLRSKEHKQCMCPHQSAGRARPNDASPAFPGRPLRFPRSGHAQAMWRHRPEPLLPEARRKYWSTNIHSVKHDTQEPSTVPTPDEDETGARVRRSARQEVQFHHQRHRKSAIAAQASHEFNMPRMGSWRVPEVGWSCGRRHIA
jgi:hypothetical protein